MTGGVGPAVAMTLVFVVVTCGGLISGIMLGKPHVSKFVTRGLTFVNLSAGVLAGWVSMSGGGVAALMVWLLLATAFGRAICPVGLTGGIASGKSSISRRLASKGAVIVDADVVAREIVEPGEPAYKEILTHFGSGVVKADRTLDRAALGRIVFEDPVQRRRLNSITHGRIAKRMLWRIVSGCLRLKLVIIDAPLLLESTPILCNLLCACVVVVTVDRDVQLARIQSRDGLTREAAEQRVAAQMSDAARLRNAHHVVDNSGSEDHLMAQVEKLWGTLQRHRSALL